MVKEVRTDNEYKCIDDVRNKVICRIEKNGNIYHAKNDMMDLTAEVVVLNDYETLVNSIEYKRKGTDGRYYKTKNLLPYALNWLVYMLEEKGFIRKPLCLNRNDNIKPMS